MSVMLIRYEGVVVGRVFTNHSMTTGEAVDFAGIDIDEMSDGDTPRYDPGRFDTELISEDDHSRVLTREAFAAILGFTSYEALMAASESVRREGDVDWFVTRLPGDRYAAWDDAELALDRVVFCDARDYAVQYHLDAARSAGLTYGEK